MVGLGPTTSGAAMPRTRCPGQPNAPALRRRRYPRRLRRRSCAWAGRSCQRGGSGAAPARHTGYPCQLANSYHQLAARNAEGHVAVQHKAKAAEHLLLAHTLSPCQHRPGTVGQFLVVGHLEHDYRAEHLAALHLMEGLLHVADADGLGDEPVKVEAALHVELDEHGEVAGGQAVAVPG